ncbi:hypothetical protein [Cohaesibacter sp. ES.047]|uniref:hypothetical protein n=1 Tax=Cohaesibacter sp. ES.047 TaxID=1798205 RepID=UPI001FCEC9EB|nr:hypothetical protein [Cohaesibacter sp. ES.047]
MSLEVPEASAQGSQVTTERIITLPRYSASSDDMPATVGPDAEASATSRASVNGEIKSEAPVVPPNVDDVEIEDITTRPSSPPPQIFRDTAALPRPVARMYDAIYSASLTGNIEALRLPIEMNEMPPVLGLEGNEGDPIDQLRALSGDPDGAEILAIMAEVLESGFVHVGQGTPQEMYVWPYLANYPFSALTQAQKVDLFRLVTSGDVEEMQAIGQYYFFRLGIAPDGTWHYFVAGD